MTEKSIVAIVGLGYVGLPLALAFGGKFSTIGYDISEKKIQAYRSGVDPAGEMEPATFGKAEHLFYTAKEEEIRRADYVIVAVPTPVDDAKQPDLTLVLRAAETVANNLKKGAVVIFESTVYPGVTENICMPLLERVSGLCCGEDFRVGYSPERVNPGDRQHTLERIVKVVAGQDAETLEKVAWLYEQVIEAGVHRAPSIRTAEAAKVIENTQRDLNIALMNELAIIFDKMGIDTMDVLDAAGTKWNFLPFRPGLVGGHCIGVDPYYLTYRSQQLGYYPEVVLAGRRINDGMGGYIVQQAVRQMIAAGRTVKGGKALVLGLTFKENCADLRNSRVIDVINELESYDMQAMVCDPVADVDEARSEHGIELVSVDDVTDADVVIAAVPHEPLLHLDLEALAASTGRDAPFIDVKSAFDRTALEAAGFRVWRL